MPKVQQQWISQPLKQVEVATLHFGGVWRPWNCRNFCSFKTVRMNFVEGVDLGSGWNWFCSGFVCSISIETGFVRLFFWKPSRHLFVIFFCYLGCMSCALIFVAGVHELSLAIPLQVGKMSTGDDYGHRQGRNGEFCVTVGPVTRTADILTQFVIWRTWAVC